MRRTVVLGIVGVCVLAGLLQIGASAQEARTRYPLMRFDEEMRSNWRFALEQVPKARIDPRVRVTRGPFTLLDRLSYVPEERNQGSCGNCWCWAGLGCMAIALDVQEQIQDRLSVQYVNSCETTAIEKQCCNGGWLGDIADFFSKPGYTAAVPWSNPGAHWQDADKGCDVAASGITTTPNYPVASISVRTIQTTNLTNTVIIDSIKNVLNQGKAIWFGFFLATDADWQKLFDMWDKGPEDKTFSMDYAAGHEWEDDAGGGHAILCVGYNDTDPNDRYWVMLNSWGTANGNRPNGLFRLDMDMNYNAYLVYEGTRYLSYVWECLEMKYDLGGTGAQEEPVEMTLPAPPMQEGPPVIDTKPGEAFVVTTPAGQSTELFVGQSPEPAQADIHLSYAAGSFSVLFEGQWIKIGSGAAPKTYGKTFKLEQAMSSGDGVTWKFGHDLKPGETARLYQKQNGQWVNTHAIACH